MHGEAGKRTHKGGKRVREMAMHSVHDEPMPRQSFANPVQNPHTHTHTQTAVAQFKKIKQYVVYHQQQQQQEAGRLSDDTE